MRQHDVISILSSGISLGNYVPGLMLRDELRALGCESRVYVLESYLGSQTLDRIEATRRAYHKNFALALTGQRMAQHFGPSLSREVADEVIDLWREIGSRRFVVLSGYWMPIVERFIAEADGPLDVTLYHIDCTESPSWVRYRNCPYQHVWACSFAEPSINYQFRARGYPRTAYGRRGKRVIAHGGGWGLGTYQDAAAELASEGFFVDTIVYSDDDVVSDPNRCFFQIDPAFRPWILTPAGDYTFPRLAPVEPRATEHPEYRLSLLALLDASMAIVSKPGGGTLIDSLATGTPLIFVDAYGEHEENNALLWERLGFGISMDDWRRNGFSMALLERMHLRLERARHEVPSFPLALLRSQP